SSPLFLTFLPLFSPSPALSCTSLYCDYCTHDLIYHSLLLYVQYFQATQLTVGMMSRIEEQLLIKINSAPEQEVLVQIEDVILQKWVMESLANPMLKDGPQKYLQDDIIDACIHILKDKNKDDVRTHGRVFIETTVVCQLLCKAACSAYPIRGQQMKHHKKCGTEYLKHDMIFLPINKMSGADVEGSVLVAGIRRRLYSKDVAGRGLGPRRRAGAMMELSAHQEGKV
ncbi:unnamed protein product, partial [Urochloa humidicola]